MTFAAFDISKLLIEWHGLSDNIDQLRVGRMSVQAIWISALHHNDEKGFKIDLAGVTVADSQIQLRIKLNDEEWAADRR